MTRTARIRKLRQAIIDYRGIYNAANGKWRQPPQHAAIERVKNWLAELGQDVPAMVERIDRFRHVDDMSKFLLVIEQSRPSTHSPI